MIKIAGRELVGSTYGEDDTEPLPEDLEGYIFERCSITRTAIMVKMLHLHKRSLIQINFEVLPGFKVRLIRAILERLDGGYTYHGAPMRLLEKVVEVNLRALGGAVEHS